MVAPRLEKDHVEFQENRITQLAKERAPGKKIRFGERAGMISFLVKDLATGTVLLATSGEWEPSILADKSPDELWRLIRHLSNYRL
jgi:hypothetical protein